MCETCHALLAVGDGKTSSRAVNSASQPVTEGERGNKGRRRKKKNERRYGTQPSLGGGEAKDLSFLNEKNKPHPRPLPRPLLITYTPPPLSNAP